MQKKMSSFPIPALRDLKSCFTIDPGGDFKDRPNSVPTILTGIVDQWMSLFYNWCIMCGFCETHECSSEVYDNRAKVLYVFQ